MTETHAAYDYLTADQDYVAYPLAAQHDRVPSRAPAVTPAQDERVRTLMAEALVVSLHEHPTVRPADPAHYVLSRQQGRDFTGYSGIAESDVDVFFDGLMAGMSFMTSAHGWKFTDVVHDLGMRLCDLAHQDHIEPVRTVADIARIKAIGRVGLVFNLESCAPIENELDRLEILFGLGIRSMGVTYNEANALGSGLAEPNDAGLTRFGHAAVERMNRIGMLIDLSHAGDRTSLETIEASRHPVTISHTGARALWPTSRMKPDDVLRACAERGGVIGIAAAPNTTLVAEDRQHDLEAVMAHFEHCAEVAGIDHVAFGPDTHFGDHVAWHRVFSAPLPAAVTPQPDVPPVTPYVDGAENPAETMRNVTRWLVVHGYADADISKVLGANIVRVLEQVWPS